MKSKIDETYSDLFTADEDRMLVLGDALLSEFESDPESHLSRAVLDYLDGYLTDADKRALFNLPPVLPPGGNVVGLKRR